MLRYIYVVYDTIAEESGPIFEAKNHEVARRHYAQIMPKDINPADFRLYCLGTVDHASNLIAAYDQPFNVMSIDAEDKEDE